MTTNNILPLFTMLTGFVLGVFYGTTFTLWRMKEQRKRRKYANRGAHMVGAPLPAEEVEGWIDEIEERRGV